MFPTVTEKKEAVVMRIYGFTSIGSKRKMVIGIEYRSWRCVKISTLLVSRDMQYSLYQKSHMDEMRVTEETEVFLWLN